MDTTSRLSKQQADDADRRRAIIEDVEWLTDCGEHPENVARTLQRWGRDSLARRLSVAV